PPRRAVRSRPTGWRALCGRAAAWFYLSACLPARNGEPSDRFLGAASGRSCIVSSQAASPARGFEGIATVIRPIAFLALVVAGIAGVAALLKPAPQTDVFTPLAPTELVYLSGLGFAGVYAAKLAHGLAAPRHDVGLFGNSRSLMVGADDLGLSDATFFNYSV